MVFSNSASELPCDVIINDSVIIKTDCLKFLGLFIDSKLHVTWRNHIDYLSKIIARNIGVINRIKICFPSSVLISLYNTLILSYLNYGILAWGNCSTSNLHKLLILQKRALRIINFVDFYAHADCHRVIYICSEITRIN